MSARHALFKKHGSTLPYFLTLFTMLPPNNLMHYCVMFSVRDSYRILSPSKLTFSREKINESHFTLVICSILVITCHYIHLYYNVYFLVLTLSNHWEQSWHNHTSFSIWGVSNSNLSFLTSLVTLKHLKFCVWFCKFTRLQCYIWHKVKFTNLIQTCTKMGVLECK